MAIANEPAAIISETMLTTPVQVTIIIQRIIRQLDAIGVLLQVVCAG